MAKVRIVVGDSREDTVVGPVGVTKTHYISIGLLHDAK